MVKGLLKQYAQLGEEQKKIDESRAAVRELIANMFEEGTSELVVDTKKMATLTKETRTLLNTELIKKNYPKDMFSDFYIESESSVLRLTKNVGLLS
jgi:hypothetical protein|tara:strand:+ start:701 stop:988 length:288 start_codon:yes stop_codon:yes gene_type:complete